MNSQILLCLSLLLTLVGCRSSSADLQAETASEEKIVVKQRSKDSLSRIDSLKFYFDRVTVNKSNKKDLRTFRKVFPSNFLEFTSTFGYDQKMGEKPLYNDAEAYIDLFFSDLYIDEPYGYKKALAISKGATWEPDAVNYFNRHLKNILLNKSIGFIEAILELEYIDQVSFWYFHFDSPHPVKEIPEYIKNLPKYKQMLKAIIKGFDSVHSK